MARIIGHAARRGSASATWMPVAAALLALVAAIAAWHEHHRHHRQAATLTTHAQTPARALRRRRAAAAPPWTERRYGAFHDDHLTRMAAAAAGDVARLSAPIDATDAARPAAPRTVGGVDPEARRAAAAAALAFSGRRVPATVEEASRHLAVVTEEIDLRAAMPAGRAAQERTERAQDQARRSAPPRSHHVPSRGRGGRVTCRGR